jgi:phosphoglycerate dehydrogenase-like enzyme
LWTHPKVTVTPHSSAISSDRSSRQAELFADNLSRFMRGEPLRQLVTEADLD